MQPVQQRSDSFLRRVGPLMLARGIAACITFVIPLVLARVMSLEEYGTYKQLILVSTTLYYILPLGVPQALYFFMPRMEKRRPLLVHTLVFLALSGGLAAALLATFMEPVARYFSNPAMLTHRWELALYVFGLMGSYPLEVSLTAKGKTHLSALSYLLSDGLRAAAMTAPVLLGHGVAGLMGCLAAYATLRLVVTWSLLLSTSRGRFWDGALLRRQLAHALPFGAAVALNILQGNSHQYAVSGIVSPEEFSLFAVGCFQLPLVDLLYTPTSEVLMVRLGDLDKQGRLEAGLEAFKKAVAGLSFAFLPLALFLFAAAPELISALFGERFIQAAPLFRVSLVGVVLAVLPLDGVLRARGFTRHIFLTQVIKAAVTVPLLWFGVHAHGMMGGMAAWAIAEVVGKLVLLCRIPAALSTPGRPVRAGQVLPLRQMGMALGASGGALLALVLTWKLAHHARAVDTSGLLQRLLPLVLAGGLFGGAYLLALWLAGVRPSRVLATLQRR